MQQRVRRGLAAAAISLVAVAGAGAAVAGAGAAVAGAGAAVAAGARLESPEEESKAIVTDAAGRLGVEPGKLEDALEQAYAARVDAAIAAGDLTEEDGAELKRRIVAGDVPLLGGPTQGHRGDHGAHGGHGRRGGRHGFGTREAAATYLGLTRAELREHRRAGTTLAELARKRGKPVDGLKTAMTAAAGKALGDAVAAGDLTEAQRARILEALPERIAAKVDGTHRDGRHVPPPDQRP